MKLSSIKIDSDAIEKGSWWELHELGGIHVKVRGLFNRDYRRVFAEKREEALRRLPMGANLPSDDLERITGECLYEAVLLDWRKLEGDDGEEIPFDKDLALVMLTDPDFVKFRNAVFRVSGQLADGMKSELERDEKNLDPASGGNASGEIVTKTSSTSRRRALQ